MPHATAALFAHRRRAGAPRLFDPISLGWEGVGFVAGGYSVKISQEFIGDGMTGPKGRRLAVGAEPLPTGLTGGHGRRG